MARMNIKKAYKKNFMLAKVLYEDGFFASYHVSKHLKNLLRIRSILLSLGSEWQQYGYLEASLYKKLEDLHHHTHKSLMVDLNDKWLTYYRRYEQVEDNLLFIMEQVEKEDFIA